MRLLFCHSPLSFVFPTPAGSAAELTLFFTLQYGGEVRERTDPPAACVFQPPPPPPPPGRPLGCQALRSVGGLTFADAATSRAAADN